MALITYADKSAMGTQPTIPDVNKITDSDMNEIKAGINGSTTYSTTEAICGTWIDNKPIYRKVVSLGALPNANTKTISSGITGTIFPIRVYGIATKSSETFPLPFIWGDTSNPNDYCGIFYSTSTNEIWFRTDRDMSAYTGYGIVEYTKTTD